MDISIKLLIYQAINFIVLMVIISFLFNKFLRPFMQKRSADIKQSFDDIEKQNAAALEMKKEYAVELDQIKLASRAEIEKAVSEGNRIKAEIKQDAEKEAVLFMEKTHKEIEQEKTKLLSDVRKEVATLTMLATKQLLKKEVDDSTNKKLVEDFLNELGSTSIQKN